MPGTGDQSLSAIVITMNEASRVRACLSSIAGWVNEIVVLDSGSTDDTVTIAREYTDRVSVTDWPGFGPQKQRALEQASGDWILSVDADEVVPDRLRSEIVSTLGTGPDAMAFSIRRLDHIGTRPLRYGRWGRSPVRLFRRAGARFSDDLVHETVIHPGGRVGRLRTPLLHYPYRDIPHAADKLRRYARVWARQRLAAGRRSNPVSGCLRAAFCLVRCLLLRHGWLDGRRGLQMALLHSRYTYAKHAGLWRLARGADSDQS